MRNNIFSKGYYNHPLGYRMSTGATNFNTKEHIAVENYYALALSVYEKFPSGKALCAMGISPDAKPIVTSDDCTYKVISSLAYVLHKVCGVQQKDIAPVLHVSKNTLRKAIIYRKGLLR